MWCSKIFILFIYFETIQISTGYRILGLYIVPIRSHWKVFDQLFKALANKGHQVDVITPFSFKNVHPNYTQIMTLDNYNEFTKPMAKFDTLKRIQFDYGIMPKLGNLMCEQIGNEEFLKLAHNPPKDPPYDLIITQMLYYHCFAILGHLWNIPVVLVSTSTFYPWMYSMVGNPDNIAIVPNNMALIPDGNGFWSRLYNTYLFYHIKFSYLYYISEQNNQLKKYFGPDAPSIRELESNISLVLLNANFPINGIQPLTQAVVEVGGLHIANEYPELSKDLKKWLDESKDGVIYFSLGSIVRIHDLPNKIINIMFKTLEKLAPMRVLIKLHNLTELNVDIPKNFYVFSWIPQENVLQHSNTKLFITHGGLLGTQESIYYGKPMLCMPVFGDQWVNSNVYVKKKIAIMLRIEDITQEEFSSAVNELLNNPIFSENVKKYSILLRDYPQKPMDTAIFWIEYIARHGKDSLKSTAVDLTWWQLALLDVIVVVIIGMLLIAYIAAYIIKNLICLFYTNKPNATFEKRKQK